MIHQKNIVMARERGSPSLPTEEVRLESAIEQAPAISKWVEI